MQFPDGNYDSEQLKVLQSALDLACTELGIKETDNLARIHIAKAVMNLRRAGQLDVERLKVYAVGQYRASTNLVKPMLRSERGSD